MNQLIGLTTSEVEDRVKSGRINKTKKGSTKKVSQIIFENVFTFFNMLSIGIVIWLVSINEWKNALGVFILIANTLIGITQEIKAKKAIDKLSLVNQNKVSVIRNGLIVEVDPSEIVIDEVVFLQKDKQIPVDGILEEGSIEVNESLLTGESKAILKKVGDKVYAGSFVVSGKAYIIASLIGDETYIEKLTSEARIYVKPKSEIFKGLQLIMRYVGSAIIPLGIIMFTLSMLNGVAYTTAVKTVAGAMIGMIPSGLFLLTSTALAASVVKLSAHKTLVQELYCIEMLARVDMLCLDKTGTITDETMSVKKTETLNELKEIKNVKLISRFILDQGETNETSLAIKKYFNQENLSLKLLEVEPFSSERKYSKAKYEVYGSFIMGAPEFILKSDYSKIKSKVEGYAQKGYRVILFAHIEKEITPLELIMIEDNIREDALKTLSFFKDNDVKIKIISGDNPITVSQISKKVEIEGSDLYCDLTGLSDEEVRQSAIKYNVFGRTTPQQKKLLIKALKDNGYTVAMTGDGVNDILALREADTSIAMASGSEAARNVSHLVLMDSNFSSMPKVVAEGRQVINNIERVAALFLTKTLFSLLVAFLSLFFSGNYPLIPIQLTLISFFTIGFPAFFLAFESNKERVKGKFSYSVLLRALPGALVVFINCLIIYLAKGYMQITNFKTVSSLVFYTTIATTYLVFLKTCFPLTPFRLALAVLMIVGIIISILFFPNFFELTSIFDLKRNEIILLGSILLSIYPIFIGISRLLRFIMRKKIV